MSRSVGSRLLLLCALVWGAAGASDAAPSTTTTEKPSEATVLRSQGAPAAKTAPKLAAKEDPFTAKDMTVQRKSVRGMLSSVTKRSISVEFSQTADSSTEMLLPVDSTLRLAHVKTLRELKPGDSVEVAYKQAFRKDEKGEPVLVATLAETVTLVKRSVERLGSTEAPSNQPSGGAP